MGIRQIVNSPEPEKKQESGQDYGGYHDYPDYSGYDTRYDGNYDSSKYKPWEDNTEPERKDMIIVNIIITYKELGKGYFDNDNIAYDQEKAEFRAKEIAYDKIVDLIGKGFESKYTIEIKPSDGYDEYDVEIILTPIKKDA